MPAPIPAELGRGGRWRPKLNPSRNRLLATKMADFGRFWGKIKGIPWGNQKTSFFGVFQGGKCGFLGVPKIGIFSQKKNPNFWCQIFGVWAAPRPPPSRARAYAREWWGPGGGPVLIGNIKKIYIIRARARI